MMNMTPSVARVLFCLSLAGLTSTLLYLFLRKDEDDEEEEIERTRTSRTTLIEVKIPSESVGVVIGRGGANIKEIQESSFTKISFKDSSGTEPYRVCVIRGTPEAAQLAESLIHEFLSNLPVTETYEMFVPQRACGRIIGKHGDTIRSISRASKAKITVMNSSRNEGCVERGVVIKGTAEEIEMAKSLIKEKVDEDEEMRKKLQGNDASQSPRKKDCQNFLTVEKDVHTDVSESQSSGLLPIKSCVFVSAIHNPDKFWLQVIEPQGLELAPLIDQMTEYYNTVENKEIHKIKELQIGQLVAAPFSFDDKWYRAEVVEITEDKNDSQESKVSLYYVDYGDSGDLKKKDIFELKTDFSQLRFQAIECCLAKVRPKDDEWSDEATDLFEELTHAAQWLPLTAQIDSYKERENRHGKPESVPCIELFDQQGSKNTSIADELVKQGFAKTEETLVPKTESSKDKVQKENLKHVKSGDVSKLGGGDAHQPSNISLDYPREMYGVDERDNSDYEFSDDMEMC